MKIIDVKNLEKTNRQVHCPKGGFISNRILLKSDGMGFGMTKTIVPKGKPQRWSYKNHLEACYCVSGKGTIYNENTRETHSITEGITYVLDENDPHIFQALEEVVLICVFNPPLTGREIHQEDGSYSL